MHLVDSPSFCSLISLGIIWIASKFPFHEEDLFFFLIAYLKNHLWVSSCSFSVLMSKNGTSGPGFPYPGHTWYGYLTWAGNDIVIKFFKIKCNIFKSFTGSLSEEDRVWPVVVSSSSSFLIVTPPYTHTDTHAPTTQLSFKLHTNPEVLLGYRGYGDRANTGMCFKTANTPLPNQP